MILLRLQRDTKTEYARTNGLDLISVPYWWDGSVEMHEFDN